jgi:hypothetical protein
MNHPDWTGNYIKMRVFELGQGSRRRWKNRSERDGYRRIITESGSRHWLSLDEPLFPSPSQFEAAASNGKKMFKRNKSSTGEVAQII